MAKAEVKVAIVGDASSLEKAAKSGAVSLEEFNRKAEKTAKEATAAFQKMQKESGRGKFFSELESGLSDIAAKVPGGSAAFEHFSGKLGGAEAAARTLGPAMVAVGVAAKGVSDFQNLAQDVLTFQRVAGTTADESSRWVEVLGDYGVAADQGATTIGKFAKVIGTQPEVLQRWGVEIQKNKDGTVDLNGTLLKAADVFSNTNDETKKAALGAALFGKSWQDLVPVLEQGSSGIRDALDSVSQGKLLDQQDLSDAEDFRLAIDGLKDVVESLSVTVGKQLVPQLKDMVSTLGTVAGAVDNNMTRPLIDAAKYINPAAPITVGLKKFAENLGKARDEMVGTKDGLGLVAGATKVFADEQKKAADAAELENKIVQEGSRLKGEHADVTAVLAEKEAKAAKATKDSEKAAADYARQLAEARKKTEDLLKASQDLWGARVIDMPKAIDDTRGALLDYYDAEKAAKEAVEKHGSASAEAQRAIIDQGNAARDIYGALDDVAKVALDNAEAQATLEGKTLTTTEKVGIQRQALEDLKKTFPELAGPIDQAKAKFGEIASVSEDTATRTEASFARITVAAQKMRDDLAGIFNSLDIGGGLSVITATADQLERQADRIVSSVASYEKRNGPGWRGGGPS